MNRKLLGKYVSSDEIVLIFENETVTANSSNPSFREIKTLIYDGNYDEAAKLANKAAEINEVFAGTSVEVKGDQVLYKGQPVHNVIVDRIFQMLQEKVDAMPLVRFLDRIMLNPSYTAVQELFLFLEANKIPITEDGCFLAWKKVRHDFKDIYSGTLDYSVGNLVEMPRNQVDEDRERTCSRGLHCAGWDYMPHFGSSGDSDRIVIVKVDPADVVAVPSDYKNAKMRVSKMLVLREYTDRKIADEFTHSVVTSNGEMFDYSGDDCDDDFYDGYEAGEYDAWIGEAPRNDRFKSEDWQDGYTRGYTESSETL